MSLLDGDVVPGLVCGGGDTQAVDVVIPDSVSVGLFGGDIVPKEGVSLGCHE